MRADGFSLVELLLALVVFLILCAGLFGLLTPDVRLARAGPAAADLQQRARVVIMGLVADLRRAGAGLAGGPHAGSLARLAPVVWPRRIGPGSPDGPSTVRADAITVLATGSAGGQGTLGLPLGFDGSLVMAPGSQCPLSASFCGFPTGSLLLVADGTGEVDLFEVTAPAGADRGLVTDWLAGRSRVYPSGSPVAALELRSYFLDAGTRQLRQAIQSLASTPAVDDVAALSFRYFGDPTPPLRPRPPLGTQNCLFDASGSPLPLVTLAGGPSSLVELPLAMFADGPWCGSGPLQFDADLLRIRLIQATLRLEATPTDVRPGQARQSLARVSDVEVAVSVAPPALGVRR